MDLFSMMNKNNLHSIFFSQLGKSLTVKFLKISNHLFVVMNSVIGHYIKQFSDGQPAK